jgi:hypothetical protein
MKRTRDRYWSLSWASLALLGACLAGCGGDDPAPGGSAGADAGSGGSQAGKGGTDGKGGSGGKAGTGGSGGAGGSAGRGGSSGGAGREEGGAGEGGDSGAMGDAGEGGDSGGGNRGPTGEPFRLNGAVHKGPFVVGSSITISVLDADLDPTGNNLSTETSNDRGEFSVNNVPGQPLGLQGEGFYYNEVTGQLSAAELTLRGFFVPGSDATQTAYVNLVTHLTNQRVRALVRAGSSFGGAVTQAEGELQTELGITLESFDPDAVGVEMTLAGGDTDANAYLFGLSTTIVQTAVDNSSGSLEGTLQELLNTLANDLSDGNLSSANRDKIRTSLGNFDVALVAARFQTRLDAIGSSAEVPEMNRVLDQDRDGIVNANDNCPRAANPSQADSDADDVGDACDTCPALACADDCIHDAVPDSAGSSGGSAGGGSGPPPVPFDFCFSGCRPYDDAALCGSDQLCVFHHYKPEGEDGRVPFEQQGMCVPSCDPLAPDCDEGESCLFYGSGAGTLGWWCQTLENGRGIEQEGDFCDPFASACAESLACVYDEDFDADVCRRVCDRTDTSACDGRECEQTTSDAALCALPAPGLGAACNPTGLACSAGDCLPCGGGSSRSCCIEVGEEGQPCTDTGGCNGDLACTSEPAACGQYDQCCVSAGGEGEPCREDGCDANLTCVSNPEACESGSCCLAAGGEGEPCRDDRSCESGLACTRTSACNSLHECCVQAGGEGGPCDDGSCNAGLSCVNDPGLCEGNDCCVSAGSEGEPCEEGACDSGLACVRDRNACGQLNECCAATGGEGQPCDNGMCDTGLACAEGPGLCPDSPSGCCVTTGGPGEPCNAGFTCDGGLSCQEPVMPDDCLADSPEPCCRP